MALGVKGISSLLQYVGFGTETELQQDVNGSLRVSQSGPAFVNAASEGRRFQGGCAVIASGIAPVAAIPTTTATLMLFNNAPAGGVSLFVDFVGVVLGSGTAAAGGTLFGSVCATPVTIPTAAANYSISSQSGSKTKASAALFGTAVTVVNPGGWSALASLNELAAANVGQSFVQAIEGRIQVPPQYGLGIGILSGAGTSPLYAVSFAWEERIAAWI